MPDTDTKVMCSSCGIRPMDKYSSGQAECWPCWYQRKLNLPAAEHWAKVAAEFLSNVDLWDQTKFFPACGLTNDEAYAMLTNAKKVLDHSKAVLADPWLKNSPIPPS